MIQRGHLHHRGDTKTIVIIILTVLLVGLILFTGCLVGLVLPSMGKARTLAQTLRSQVHLEEIAQAVTLAAVDDEESGAAITTRTIDQLVAEGRITVDATRSPFGPVADGGPDYWLHPDAAALELSALDNDRTALSAIVAYDRAMYANHREVAVQYLIGQSDVLSIEDFDGLLRSLERPDAGYDLPTRAP